MEEKSKFVMFMSDHHSNKLIAVEKAQLDSSLKNVTIYGKGYKSTVSLSGVQQRVLTENLHQMQFL